MKYRKLSYFDEFHCRAGECPENCCRGWQIPLAEEDLTRYREMKGEKALGLNLRILLGGKDPFLNPSGGICPYLLEKEGLCELQKKRGEEYLPLVCKLFPRRQINYGPVTEQSLFLSCVEASRLFLEHESDLHYIEVENGPDLPVYGDNDDEAYFRRVEESRERIFELLHDSCVRSASGEAEDFSGFEETLKRIRRYAGKLQDACIRYDSDSLKQLCENPVPVYGKEDADEEKLPDKSLFPLPITVLNELMSTRFYQKKMKEKIPELYRLCHVYFRIFDPLTEEAGQERFDELLSAYLRAGGRTSKYVHYLQYYLLTYYGEVFEDYSFTRRIDYGILHANMLLLMDLCRFAEAGQKLPDPVSEARTLAVYEKRGLHSRDLQREMYDVFTKYYLGR
ncbi:MAG: flagellin lysine-N-methylase [Lachnospiraceae bacterium]|nr:flagellin lysine-N-methylase [Lachnospiraceae bacterium]